MINDKLNSSMNKYLGSSIATCGRELSRINKIVSKLEYMGNWPYGHLLHLVSGVGCPVGIPSGYPQWGNLRVNHGHPYRIGVDQTSVTPRSGQVWVAPHLWIYTI